MHHNKKVDAPSGTALLFGEAAAAGREHRSRDAVRARARRHTGARKAGNIGFASLRGGTVRGRAQRDLRGRRRAHRADAQGDRPHDLRARCAEGRTRGRAARSRGFTDARCAGVEGLSSPSLRANATRNPAKAKNWDCFVPARCPLCGMTRSSIDQRHRPSSPAACGSSISASSVGAMSARRPSRKRDLLAGRPAATGTGFVVCAVCGPPVTGSRIISQLP